MGWTTVFFILSILAGILGIWNLAQQRNVFLSLTGILWFLVLLFEQYIPKAYNYHIASGMPSIGTLFLYVVIPVFIILSFFTSRTRR
jgi:hypothetical protein